VGKVVVTSFLHAMLFSVAQLLCVYPFLSPIACCDHLPKSFLSISRIVSLYIYMLLSMNPICDVWRCRVVYNLHSPQLAEASNSRRECPFIKLTTVTVNAVHVHHRLRLVLGNFAIKSFEILWISSSSDFMHLSSASRIPAVLVTDFL